jgi:uncharacterized protein YacL
MNKKNRSIDELSNELLKKSMLRPASSDFNDHLMEKILLTTSPAKLKSNGNNVKKAWIFWIVAVVFFLISVMIVATFSGGYFTEINYLFKLTFTYVLYGGMALFIPLVLYQLDSLIQLMFWKRNGKISIT